MPDTPQNGTLGSGDILLIDTIVPGFGSFYIGATGRGIAIAVGRVLTAYCAAQFWVEAKEYQSVAKAAKVAELYYGPGYRYKNPYGPGFLYPKGTARTRDAFTADEYQHIADRRLFLVSLSLTLHAVIWGAGALGIKSDLQESEEKRLPIFDIGPDGKPGKSSAPGGTAVRVGVQFLF